MSDGFFSLPNLPSATFRAASALARVWLRVRARMARHRRHEGLADLSDWILRDIGVIHELDLGTSLDVDPREAARQFWRP